VQLTTNDSEKNPVLVRERLDIALFFLDTCMLRDVVQSVGIGSK